jgi:hypothetical protein
MDVEVAAFIAVKASASVTSVLVATLALRSGFRLMVLF